MRIGCRFDHAIMAELDLGHASEIVKVGVLPTNPLDPIGTVLNIGGQLCAVTAYCTREEFLSAVEAAGLDPLPFKGVAADMKFERITTD